MATQASPSAIEIYGSGNCNTYISSKFNLSIKIMQIKDLTRREFTIESTRTRNTFLQFEKLLNELRGKNLKIEIIEHINRDIDEINSVIATGDSFRRLIKKRETKIIEILEKTMKLVPINYYRNYWMSVGLAAFGLPLGVVFGTVFGNMAFIGVGLPLGLVIGQAVGTHMDKKAKEEGRQLNLKIE